MDRNSSREVNICIAGEVALRKESVDRNKRSPTAGQLGAVALRKESVDRNWQATANITQGKKSLSARRAWIEMAAACRPARGVAVALRKESVDRNL